MAPRRKRLPLRFPGLRLADIHSCIAYCLNHEEEIDRYLAGRRQAATDLKERISGDPQQQLGIREMRERIELGKLSCSRKPLNAALTAFARC